jgi:serine/threonine-protein kinase HipA
MSRCPITYEEIPEGERYSLEGLRRLARQLRQLHEFPYSAQDQVREAIARASKMSIQGVQPKLSARLNIGNAVFEIVDTNGEYILKPQTQYPEVPENEDLTMRLAAMIGIEVPLHGLIYSKDGSFTYFIRRFDRDRKKGKLPLEDFAQLLGKSRETKYDSSMEQLATVIDEFCTFPAVEKAKLFRRALFCFLVGNEDMHLKNYSLISRDDKVELSPCYDLLNTTIALPKVEEEIALPLGGKKKHLTRSLFLQYFGNERLRLPNAIIDDTLKEISRAMPSWERDIGISFLSKLLKDEYLALLRTRWAIVGK